MSELELSGARSSLARADGSAAAHERCTYLTCVNCVLAAGASWRAQNASTSTRTSAATGLAGRVSPSPTTTPAGAAGSSRGSPAGATADLYSSDAAADAVQEHQREASDLLRALFATSGGGSGGGGGGLSVVVDADADEEQRDSMAIDSRAGGVSSSGAPWLSGCY